jgi:ATP-dependent DNA ligase
MEVTMDEMTSRIDELVEEYVCLGMHTALRGEDFLEARSMEQEARAKREQLHMLNAETAAKLKYSESSFTEQLRQAASSAKMMQEVSEMKHQSEVKDLHMQAEGTRHTLAIEEAASRAEVAGLTIELETAAREAGLRSGGGECQDPGSAG